MFNKIALAVAIIAGTATVAFAEDSSSSFTQNVYGQAARQQYTAPAFTNRNVALGGQVIVRTPAGADRASSSYGGSSF